MTASPQLLRVIRACRGQFTPGRGRSSGSAAGSGEPGFVTELSEEVDEVTQPLKVQQRQGGLAWRRWELLGAPGVGPAHGNSRVRAIGQAQDQVGISAAADGDHLTSLATERMMGMGDGHRFQKRLG
jgi:hypothetical protein